MIAIVVVAVLVTHVAPLAQFLELATAIFCLAAVLTVLTDRLIQVLLGFVYVPSTPVVLVGVGWNCRSSQQRCA